MVIIGVLKPSTKSALYKHKCLENINKLYKTRGKYDNNHIFKSITKESMI